MKYYRLVFVLIMASVFILSTGCATNIRNNQFPVSPHIGISTMKNESTPLVKITSGQYRVSEKTVKPQNVAFEPIDITLLFPQKESGVFPLVGSNIVAGFSENWERDGGFYGVGGFSVRLKKYDENSEYSNLLGKSPLRLNLGLGFTSMLSGMDIRLNYLPALNRDNEHLFLLTVGFWFGK